MPHAPYLECLARRLAGERHTVVYSGDTAPAVLVPLAEGTDLLIHKAYSHEALRAHGEGMSEPARAGLEQAYGATHSDARSVARIAREAGARLLALTHLLPEEQPEILTSAAQDEYDGQIVVARDGVTIEV